MPRLASASALAGSRTLTASEMRGGWVARRAAREAALRTKLIARSTRRLSLTAAGSAYLEKCGAILGLIEEAESGLTEERAAPSGPIRVSVPLSFGIRHLMPMMMDFTTANP